MSRQSVKRISSWGRLYALFTLLTLITGCASAQPPQRPFFLSEEGLETHGRKTTFDRIFEADPGGLSVAIAPDYQERPPRKIAVLPFWDASKGGFLVNKISLLPLDEKELSVWSWTHANRVRRALAGDIAAREFFIVSLLRIDALLIHHGISDVEKLNAVPPEELGCWLDVDTLVYGELLSYEAYYGFLVSSWKVSVRVRMISATDGHEIFSCTDSRFSSSVLPAIFPVDIAINSALSLVHLRDITLARTEYEVGREIALSIPRANRNIADFLTEAKD